MEDMKNMKKEPKGENQKEPKEVSAVGRISAVHVF